MKLTYFILNMTVWPASDNDPMDTCECLCLGKYVPVLLFGNIGKSYSPSNLYLMIYPLGIFSLVIFLWVAHCLGGHILP